MTGMYSAGEANLLSIRQSSLTKKLTRRITRRWQHIEPLVKLNNRLKTNRNLRLNESKPHRMLEIGPGEKAFGRL